VFVPAVEVSSVPEKNASGACNNITLRTSFAPLRVYLSDGGYDVTAHTSFGKINTDVPFTATGGLNGDTLNGKINAGGCVLQLTNGNGNIEILKGAPRK